MESAYFLSGGRVRLSLRLSFNTHNEWRLRQVTRNELYIMLAAIAMGTVILMALTHS